MNQHNNTRQDYDKQVVKVLVRNMLEMFKKAPLKQRKLMYRNLEFDAQYSSTDWSRNRKRGVALFLRIHKTQYAKK